MSWTDKRCDFWMHRLRRIGLFPLLCFTGKSQPLYAPSKEIGGLQVEAPSKYKDGTPTKSLRQDFVYQNDVHLKRLLTYLKETDDPRRPGRPLIENTLVIFTSDNGAEIDNKRFTGPLRSHKGSTYEGGHRVPFIASWPLGNVGDGNDKTSGATRSSLIALNDLYATFAEMVGSRSHR